MVSGIFFFPSPVSSWGQLTALRPSRRCEGRREQRTSEGGFFWWLFLFFFLPAGHCQPFSSAARLRQGQERATLVPLTINNPA